MKDLRMLIRMTIALGVLSLFFGLMSHLALTDIYHGEPDLTLEWSIVRAGACVLITFIGMSLFTLSRTLKVLALPDVNRTDSR